jgi:hypothetical protein
MITPTMPTTAMNPSSNGREPTFAPLRKSAIFTAATVAMLL